MAPSFRCVRCAHAACRASSAAALARGPEPGLEAELVSGLYSVHAGKGLISNIPAGTTPDNDSNGLVSTGVIKDKDNLSMDLGIVPVAPPEPPEPPEPTYPTLRFP